MEIVLTILSVACKEIGGHLSANSALLQRFLETYEMPQMESTSFLNMQFFIHTFPK
jgi:hypothetical protein